MASVELILTSIGLIGHRLNARQLRVHRVHDDRPDPQKFLGNNRVNFSSSRSQRHKTPSHYSPDYTHTRPGLHAIPPSHRSDAWAAGRERSAVALFWFKISHGMHIVYNSQNICMTIRISMQMLLLTRVISGELLPPYGIGGRTVCTRNERQSVENKGEIAGSEYRRGWGLRFALCFTNCTTINAIWRLDRPLSLLHVSLHWTLSCRCVLSPVHAGKQSFVKIN